jgi:hypothetical protein
MAADWLEELKPGDKVLYGSHRDDSIGVVERVTPTQIIVGGTRYNRKTGRRVGPYSGFCRPRIQRATAERLAEVETANRKARAVYTIRRAIESYDADKVHSLESLEAAAKLLSSSDSERGN